MHVALRFVVMAPAGTPADIVMRLSTAIADSVAEPEFAQLLRQQGYEPFVTDPAESASLLREESIRWGPLLRAADIRHYGTLSPLLQVVPWHQSRILFARVYHRCMRNARQALLVDPPPRENLAGDEQDPLSDRLARQIRLGILRGDSPAGSRLNLDELKGRYNVSLSPLREALSRLLAEGFVSFEAKRGFRVTEMSGANLAEIVTIRRLCEPVGVRIAVSNGDDEWEERVAAAYHTLGKRTLAKPTSPNDWENAHRKFHLAVLSGCEMPMMLHFCSTLMDLQDRYRLQFSKQGTYTPHVAAEQHIALFDACVRRDAKRAETLTLQHIDATYEQLAAAMAGAGAASPARADPPRRKRSAA